MMMVSDDCLVECPIDDDDDEEEEEDEDDAALEIEPPPPPPPQFASKPPTPPSPAATPPTAPATPTSEQPKTRDLYGINQHLKVEFSDVLAEPAWPHSADRVWTYSAVGFETARLWGYRCLSALCAVPLALLSGILLALLACLHIWCVMPCIQVCHTCLPCVRSLWMAVVNIFISPLCSSIALCCSQISISLAKEQP
ncbi:caveolin-2 [Aplochiton taeniatus]